jgi:hypothetical protein
MHYEFFFIFLRAVTVKINYVNIEGDPREPDIFKINSTQLFLK